MILVPKPKRSKIPLDRPVPAWACDHEGMASLLATGNHSELYLRTVRERANPNKASVALLDNYKATLRVGAVLPRRAGTESQFLRRASWTHSKPWEFVTKATMVRVERGLRKSSCNGSTRPTERFAAKKSLLCQSTDHFDFPVAVLYLVSGSVIKS